MVDRPAAIIDSGDEEGSDVRTPPAAKPAAKVVDEGGGPVEDSGEARRPTRRVSRRPASGAEALDAAERHLTGEDPALTAERLRSTQLQGERDQAASTAHQATVQLLNEREANLKSQVHEAESAKATAQAALRMARETGDMDAEEKALDALNDATYRKRRAEERLADLATDKERIAKQPAQGTADPNGYPPGDQEWISRHPMFNSDSLYKARVIGAATAAVNAGHRQGTPSYYDFIDKEVTTFYGPGHGVAQTHGRRQPADRDVEHGASSGMPRSSVGAEGSAGSGWRTVETPGGTVQVRDGSDGVPVVRIPTAIRKQWEEAARWTKMDLATYALEQVKAGEEISSGESGGLYYSEGESYR